MKRIMKNIATTLRRFRTSVALNVAGMSLAFAVAVILLSRVHYERSYDSFWPEGDRIFRVEMNGSTIWSQSDMDDAAAASAHIERVSAYSIYSSTFVVESPTGRQGYTEWISPCYPALTDILSMRMVEGTAEALEEPGKVLIPCSLARRSFGGQSAVGRSVDIEDNRYFGNSQKAEVGGVYEDFPSNSVFRNAVFTPLLSRWQAQRNNRSYMCFVKLDAASSREEVRSDIERKMNEIYRAKGDSEKKQTVELTPMRELRYTTAYRNDSLEKGSRSMELLMWVLTLSILVIAVINYINFSSALAPVRIRIINIHKVFGAGCTSLRASVLAESALFALAAWALSLLEVAWISATPLADLISVEVFAVRNLPTLLLTGAAALATGVAAGLYPAFYMTSFPPAFALKGSFALSATGGRLRTALVSFQYVISAVLIVATLGLWRQNVYNRNMSSGFDREEVLVARIHREVAARSELFTQRLRSNPAIVDVAYADQVLGAGDTYNGWAGRVDGHNVQLYVTQVSPNYLRVLGIPVEEGRDFTQADGLRSDYSLIFSTEDMQAHDLYAGQRLTVMNGYPASVSGFCAPFRMTSNRAGKPPYFCFAVSDNSAALNQAHIRIAPGTDAGEVFRFICETSKEIYPESEPRVEFLSSRIDGLYERERRLGGLIAACSGISILISLAGVFGLVLFETRFRRREIAIRRVNGATVGEVVRMFNRRYLTIAVVCFVLASPAAYLAVDAWQRQFVEKAPLAWWLYPLGLALLAALTSATVTLRCYRAATENPVTALKSE